MWLLGEGVEPDGGLVIVECYSYVAELGLDGGVGGLGVLGWED